MLYEVITLVAAKSAGTQLGSVDADGLVIGAVDDGLSVIAQPKIEVVGRGGLDLVNYQLHPQLGHLA